MGEALASALRYAGFDCLTTTEADRRRQPDEAQLAFATKERRIIFTANVQDFPRIHWEWIAAGRHHAGIIVLTDQRTTPGDIQRAMVALRNRFPGGIAGELEYLLNWIPRK